VLRLRLLTALVLGPAVLAAVLLLPTPWFAPLFLLLAAVALNEWLALARVHGRTARLLLIALYIAAGYATLSLPLLQLPLLLITVAVWVFALLVVLTFPASARWLARVPAGAGVGLLVMWGAWLALVLIHRTDGGPWLVLWLLAVVVAADTGGYFGGRAFGRHKLAVAVSPGKTWEGVAGGLALALIVGVLLGIWLPALDGMALPGWFWAAAAPPLVAVSIIGDLFESALKRVAGVKDSGTLLPGHGGLLDRIDAMLAALPWFALTLVGAGVSATG
jgi:phosphatidate cytidylyltransferase